MWGLLRDLFDFSRQNRLWWILPIALALIAIGALAVFVESSAIAPWIYAMF